MSIGKILIVEDDELSAKVLRQSVEQLGYAISAISSTAQMAIEHFRATKPDIVLMDFHLGDGMDGVDLIVELNRIKHTPVVFITSVESEAEIDKILQHKPDAYVQKPIALRELRAVLELVTYKFRKEIEMEDLNRNLERRVKERTEELDIAVKSLIREMSDKEKLLQQLEKALKTEKQFGELKSKMISNLSHEFKTPLSSIRSSAQILARIISITSKDERGLKHVNRIEDSAGMLNDLLARILSVERDQDKLYQAELIDIDFPVFLENFQAEFEGFVENDVSINYQVELCTDMVRTDPKLVRLILNNLLSNAVKYSHPAGEVNVLITSTPGELSISIEDFGIGMDQEDLAQIQYRFFRGKNVGSIEGTGIGMSIVNRSLKSLMGQIEVVSELNKGTVVKVSIPLIEA